MATLKISEMTEADLPLDGTEDIEIVQNALTKRCSTQDIADLANGSLPYKIWRGLVTQSASGDPTFTELENTLGGTITIPRTSAGTYTITSSGLFTLNKTFISPKYGTLRQGSNYATVLVAFSNINQVQLSTYLNGVAADDLLTDHPIEIIVYN